MVHLLMTSLVTADSNVSIVCTNSFTNVNQTKSSISTHFGCEFPTNVQKKNKNDSWIEQVNFQVLLKMCEIKKAYVW